MIPAVQSGLYYRTCCFIAIALAAFQSTACSTAPATQTAPDRPITAMTGSTGRSEPPSTTRPADLCGIRTLDEFEHEFLVGRTVMSVIQTNSVAVARGVNSDHPPGTSVVLMDLSPGEHADLNFDLYKDVCHTAAYRKMYSKNSQYCIDEVVSQQTAPSH